VKEGLMPFCPDCGTEYYEGQSYCSRCHVPLKDSLPEGRSPEDVWRDYQERQPSPLREHFWRDPREQHPSPPRWAFLKAGVFFVSVCILGVASLVVASYPIVLWDSGWAYLAAFAIFILMAGLIVYCADQADKQGWLASGLFVCIVLLGSIAAFLIAILAQTSLQLSILW
jgi:hypothetical protein